MEKDAGFTASAEGGLINHDDYVQYPFGHSLSYTTFTQKIQNFDDRGGTISFDVNVTNTSSVTGEDVVEVCFIPPHTNGGIGRAYVNLVQFGKTKLLESGTSGAVTIQAPIAKGAWIT